MSLSQFDSGASFFSGGSFSSSQSTQSTDPTLSKSRNAHGVIPLTVKQISDAYQSSENKAALAVDGVDAAHVVILGLVTNKTEKSTDVSFTLDDGTGRINVIRWVNDSADADEGAVIQNGLYMVVIGSLKGFQGKMQLLAFSVRPVVDYNEIPLHFIHCIQIHAEHSRKNIGASAQLPGNLVNPIPSSAFNGSQENQLTPNQHSAPANKSDASADIYKLVLDVFEEPASLYHFSGQASTGCMWMKSPENWAFLSRRSRKPSNIMLMLDMYTLQLMTITSSLPAPADMISMSFAACRFLKWILPS